MIAEIVTADADDKRAVVFAGDYLNKLTGEQIERECRRRLDEGCMTVSERHCQPGNKIFRR